MAEGQSRESIDAAREMKLKKACDWILREHKSGLKATRNSRFANHHPSRLCRFSWMRAASFEVSPLKDSMEACSMAGCFISSQAT